MAETGLALGTLRVVVCWHWAPGDVREWPLTLPSGSRVRDAIEQLSTTTGVPWAAVDAGLVGVWGRCAAGEQVLADGDRVEIYRPLTVDPKTARRERFKRQGTRGAGLFAKRRPGAKAGY